MLPAIYAGLCTLFSTLVMPNKADACACGCGIFEVGDFEMFPHGDAGHGFAYFDWDYQNQDHNWSGSSRAPAEDNSDKALKTRFYTAGIQYNFDRRFSMQVEVPYVDRTFSSLGGATGDQRITHRWSQLGDVRVTGIYTGLLRDQPLGLILGLKLPTGDFKHTEPGIDVDRDTQVGTGSTDLLLGAFYQHQLKKGGSWWVFAQVNLDIPMFSQDGYAPGVEADESLGFYYDGWSIGKAKIRPIGQILASERSKDSGPNSANPVASGYERILLSPGIEVDLHPVMIDANVEFPVYQYVTGNQLTSQLLIKVSLSFRF